MLLIFAACDNFSRLQATSSSNTASATASEKEHAPGRFSLLHATTRLSSGREVPIVLRIDSVTGETWTFAADPDRWVHVEDDLQRAGKYNPQTKKIEWGVKLPDGRDLNELSKEELIRYLSSAIRNGQSPNPKDPLGLFEEQKPRPPLSSFERK